MSNLVANLETELAATLQRDGFAFADAATMRALLEQRQRLDDWASFAASWNDLALDAYLAAHGRYRRRRYAVFSTVAHDPIQREPHQPHYQGLQYNPLQGGIERWFEPIRPEIGASVSLRSILAFAHALFGGLAPAITDWHIEVHQFRIQARPDEPGQPTPEGAHRDGVDYVLVLLIDRRNIVSGTTAIHAPDGRVLGEFTLAAPFDAALVVDERVHHSVTPVQPLDPRKPAHRDVLVVTFRRQGRLRSPG